MIFIEHEKVPAKDLHKFLAVHSGETISLMEVSEGIYDVSVMKDYTESHFYTEILRSFDNRNLFPVLTMEEKNAIDYAIGAIKTLVDMGVLK